MSPDSWESSAHLSTWGDQKLNSRVGSTSDWHRRAMGSVLGEAWRGQSADLQLVDTKALSRRVGQNGHRRWSRGFLAKRQAMEGVDASSISQQSHERTFVVRPAGSTGHPRITSCDAIGLSRRRKFIERLPRTSSSYHLARPYNQRGRGRQVTTIGRLEELCSL
jgi:hypothetical protein